MKHLQFAFREKGIAEIKKITQESLTNFFKTYLELACFSGFHREQLLNEITIEGKEHLDFLLAQGKGVIIVSAHLNNFALMILKLAHEGYPIKIAVRNLKGVFQSYLYTHFLKEVLNLNPIITKPTICFFREVMQHLQGNGIICLLADENKRHGGIFVNFFGKPAATATGSAHLALKSFAPILPVFMVRVDDWRQKIVIEPPLTYKLSGVKRDDLQMITSQFTKVIESYVSKYPSQWKWDHFRWKTKMIPKSKKTPSQLNLLNDKMFIDL